MLHGQRIYCVTLNYYQEKCLVVLSWGLWYEMLFRCVLCLQWANSTRIRQFFPTEINDSNFQDITAYYTSNRKFIWTLKVCLNRAFLLTAVFFLEYWKRKEITLAYQWDVLGFEEEEVRQLNLPRSFFKLLLVYIKPIDRPRFSWIAWADWKKEFCEVLITWQSTTVGTKRADLHPFW